MDVSSMLSPASGQAAPKRHGPGKSVAFELLLDEGSKTRARIPLRVKVNAHDTTESIISTVKNFYGIYDGNGVSFEDAKGHTLIASYDNLSHGDTVYVRSLAGPPQPSQTALGQYGVASAHEPGRGPSLGDPFQMLPPHLREQSHSPSRSSSRLAVKRSTSPPLLRGRRSASQQKAPSSFPVLSRGSSASRSCHENEGMSDSDAGRSSLSGSRKAKSEQIVSSEISTANVLQDGRRGQTIFDSSTLPLFVPPQVPVAASQSSISPQRRSLPLDGPSPFRPPAQKLYGLQHQPVLSPMSHGRLADDRSPEHTAEQSQATPATHGHHLRDRNGPNSAGSYRGRAGYSGQAVLPTPDPTVASCISDEDVARTLIALGDASNYSHGRTSTSTMDDTFSGHEYEELQGPKTKKIKTKVYDGPGTLHRSAKSSGAASVKATKPAKGRAQSLPKTAKAVPQPGPNKAHSTPNAATGPPRKSSINFQHQLAADEEDLSTKPRCQRCRKSKKGCDRQRPCQRCKDAGIGIEGCISEDEGNGRKGRFGRHMGVPVKKAAEVLARDSKDDEGMMLPPLTAAATPGSSVSAPSFGSPDKGKKRKR
ncbi:hypothetical protein DV738_g4414, partial [Chaetothyriales sp. CBS 135597]